MKNVKRYSLVLQFVFVFILNSIGQNANEFKIGMFSTSMTDFQLQNGGVCSDLPYNAIQAPFGNAPHNPNAKTSFLNVLKEDGFNIMHGGYVFDWQSSEQVKGMLMLADQFGIQYLLNVRQFFHPDYEGTDPITGINIFDNCGIIIPPCNSPKTRYFTPSYDYYFNSIFTQPNFKNIVWGYQVTEEASYWHDNHWYGSAPGVVTAEYPNGSDHTMCEGTTSAPNCTVFAGNHICGDYKLTEVPPILVGDAISHFKNLCNSNNVTNHKMVIMEANHGKSVNAITVDGQGVFNPQDYINLLSNADGNDVYFEGSYLNFPEQDCWKKPYINMDKAGPFDNWHYLSKFKNIDYAKTKVHDVHSVINFESDYQQYIHSMPSFNENANSLWFQAYTSIIHGAKGIWFWQLYSSWNAADIASGRKTNYENTNNGNRFERHNFPILYNKYISKLAKEISYLSNNGIISADPSTILYTKTDHADSYCIVPPANQYITNNNTGINLATIGSPSPLGIAEWATEKYGLRYTIRTNGSDVYMIISNPLNCNLNNVALNFASVGNQIIQNSTGVKVLFDNGNNAHNSNLYKLNRNSNIDLVNNNIPIGSFYNLSFTNGKQLNLSFGPMDVKVLKFVSPPPVVTQDWSKVWSNHGSGWIDGHPIKSTDLFYVGDFDGDGTQELFCVENTGGANDWMTMLKYDNGDWHWLWSNYGNPQAGGGIYLYRDNLIVGDYNADGKDDIFGNAQAYGNWATMFQFNNGNWHWIWSDFGNTAHGMWPYKQSLHQGKYTGFGWGELFASDISAGGWTSVFLYNGNDFVIMNWVAPPTHGITPYRQFLHPGDFDGDGYDDVLSIGGNNLASTLFRFDWNANNNVDWNWTWSNSSTPGSFGGWPYPPAASDKILVGNIDNDPNDEILIIENSPNAGSAASFDFQAPYNLSLNWSSSNSYINDWSINPGPIGSDTRYILVKAVVNDPEYLLAMRNIGCTGYLVNMYKTNTNMNFRSTLPIAETIAAESDISTKLEQRNIIFESDFLIFPNPTQSEVNIRLKNAALQNSIVISDLQGKEIFSTQHSESRDVKIDLSGLALGMYIIKVTNIESTSYQKLIIK